VVLESPKAGDTSGLRFLDLTPVWDLTAALFSSSRSTAMRWILCSPYNR